MWGKRSEVAAGPGDQTVAGDQEIDLAQAPDFSIGRIKVQPSTRQIELDGKYRTLEPRVMQVFVALAQRGRQVVSRDQLAQWCWGGRIVGDDALNRCIAKVRHLGSESGAFEIQTIPRVGYRLAEENEASSATRPKLSSPRWQLMGAPLSVLLVATGLLYWIYGADRTPGRRSTTAMSVALLPFTAASSDAETVKLAAATREALANTLSQGAYAVSAIDRTPQSMQAPADFIISGQLSSAANKFIATVRMEETAHHVVVFAHQFEEPRNKADDLPDLVGGEVASQISETTRLAAIDRQHPSDPTILASVLEASDAGLYGSGVLHDYERARPLAENNPDSALAQLNFAYDAGFALGEIPREERAEAVAAGRRAADRAVALAPEYGDSYAPWCLLRSQQKRVECEDRLRTGMRIDPDSGFAGWFLAQLVLDPVGRKDEALELARASLAHDPFMPAKIALMLRMSEATGQTGEADALFWRSTRWWPDDGGLNGSRTEGIAEAGDFERLARFATQTGDPKKPDPVFAAVAGKSLPGIKKACLNATDLDGAVCVLALARFGDPDAAFAMADRLYPQRRGRTPAEEDQIWLDNLDPGYVDLLTSRAAAPLRRDPRFLGLAERVGLLDYWRTGRLPDFCTKAHEPECAQIAHR